MPETLSIIRTVCLLVFGIALSASLHGLFSMQRSGVWFVPIILLVVVFACFALPQDIQFYGWMTAIAILLGIILWSV